MEYKRTWAQIWRMDIRGILNINKPTASSEWNGNGEKEELNKQADLLEIYLKL